MDVLSKKTSHCRGCRRQTAEEVQIALPHTTINGRHGQREIPPDLKPKVDRFEK